MVKRSRNFIFAILFGLIFLNVFAWQAVYNLYQDRSLKVVFFDVGQGDSILTEWMQYIPSYLGLNSLI